MKTMTSFALGLTAAVLVVTCIPARASETDERIESSFKNSFVYRTYLNDDSIKISSKDGAVTLSGEVAFETHKPLAQDTAEALPGVKSVDNRIALKMDSPAEKSDSWIGIKVKGTLMFHRNVSAASTEVDVKDGTVTLRGHASSQAQKELTTEYAKDVEGVRDIKNEMTVSGSENKPIEKIEKTAGKVVDTIDDASITALVKVTLLSHRSTSVMRTAVSTNDGVVTVGGSAKNGAEKDLVSKLVEDVHGVKSVKNTMVVN